MLGQEAEVSFWKEQALHFAGLWRVIVPIAFGMLLLSFALADGFLGHTQAALESQSVYALAQQSSEMNEVASLKASSTAFNQSVALISSLEAGLRPKNPVITEIQKVAASSSISIARVFQPSSDSQINFSGSAQSEDAIIAFKRAIEADPHFGPSSLPLTGITQNGNTFSFSMTFPLSAAPFE